VIARWRSELASSGDDTELRKRISRYEDAGHGDCLLRHAPNAALVESSLFHADGQRYRLLDWCIMPNHVHALIEPLEGCSLGEIIRTWKTFSAREINKLEKRTGPLWSREYHDRYIRDQEHYDSARAYIRMNPVKAGLCRAAEDWRWSSAYYGNLRP
jgi:REP element-mobilizing transposase RayT